MSLEMSWNLGRGRGPETRDRSGLRGGALGTLPVQLQAWMVTTFPRHMAGCEACCASPGRGWGRGA